jgi:hypothetical protein
LQTCGSFRILLPFFRTSWGDGVLNSAIFNIFHNWVEFGTILEGLQNFGGVLHPPKPLPRYATDPQYWKGISSNPYTNLTLILTRQELQFYKILSRTAVPNVSENISDIVAAFLTNRRTQNDKKYSQMQKFCLLS